MVGCFSHTISLPKYTPWAARYLFKVLEVECVLEVELVEAAVLVNHQGVQQFCTEIISTDFILSLVL